MLKSSQEERMPTDVPMSPKRHEARRLNTLCDPSVHQESIEEEEEEEEEPEPGRPGANSPSHRLSPADLVRHLPLSRGVGLSSVGRHSHHSGPQHHMPHQDGKLVRRGPGYSELSPIPENSGSATSPTEESSSGGSAFAGLTFGSGGGGGSSVNSRTDMLHQLVSRIEQAVEMMGSEAQAISEGRQPTFPSQHLQTTSSSLNEEEEPLSRDQTGSESRNGSGVMSDQAGEETTMTDNQDLRPAIGSGFLYSNPQSFTYPMPGSKDSANNDSNQKGTTEETSFEENKSAQETPSLSPSRRRQLPAIPTTSPVPFSTALSNSSVSPSSSSSSASSSARTSPERKSGSGRGSGMRNSGGSCKDMLPAALTPSPTSQAMVAALAGQVALDIAAMDTDNIQTPDGATADIAATAMTEQGEVEMLEASGSPAKADGVGIKVSDEKMDTSFEDQKDVEI